MEEGRNNRAVERRIKEALKNDRARIQVGRISHFGLLEMSRQRIRAGVIEGSTVPCPHCAGAGHVRSTASIALHVLRVLEEALVKSASHNVTLRTRAVVALYILNQKRAHLHELERRFGVHITVAADDTLTGAIYHALERGELASGPRLPVTPAPLRVDSLAVAPLDEEEFAETEVIEEEAAEAIEDYAPAMNGRPRRDDRGPRPRFGADEGEEEAARGRRRRRRRGRGGGATGGEQMPLNAEQPSDEGLAAMVAIEGSPAPREPRPERGGRRERGPGRWRRSAPLPEEFLNPTADFPRDPGLEDSADFVSPGEAHLPPFAAEPAPAVAKILPPAEAAPEAPPVPEIVVEPAAPPASREPTEVVITEADPDRPKKGGWWQRVRTPFGG